MALTTLSVAVSVLVLKVHHMSPAYEVPGWVQRPVPCPRLGPATGTRCQAATGTRYQVGFSNWYLVPGWVRRLVRGPRLGSATGTWYQAGSSDWYSVVCRRSCAVGAAINGTPTVIHRTTTSGASPVDRFMSISRPTRIPRPVVSICSFFLQRDAMLARSVLWPVVRLSVCLSHAGIVSTRLNGSN